MTLKAVLLTLEKYDLFLDLLDDEVEGQDEALAACLHQASAQPAGGERQFFRDYLRQRETSRAGKI